MAKARKYFGQGDYPKARRYYTRALSNEKRKACLPKWTGQQYEYKFDKYDTSRAILGIADTYKQEGKHDKAVYHYFQYVQFCLRHDLNFDHAIESIRAYVSKHEQNNESETLQKLLKNND